MPGVVMAAPGWWGSTCPARRPGFFGRDASPARVGLFHALNVSNCNPRRLTPEGSTEVARAAYHPNWRTKKTL